MTIIFRQSFFIIFSLLLVSCATQQLWNAHNPYEYIKIQGPSSIEEKISTKGVDYFCKDIVYSSEGHEKVCYVEKTSAEKIKEWNIRLLETPVAVVKDMASAVTVVGYVILQSLFEQGYSGGW
jgi:hypothetical protein